MSRPDGPRGDRPDGLPQENAAPTIRRGRPLPTVSLEQVRSGGYVALGSSFAAGAGLAPRSEGTPRAARQAQGNYPHLLAGTLDMALRDVTSSGATTDDLLTRSQHGQPPQVDAVDARTSLVTITVGGNDIGYIPALLAASLPRPFTALPAVRRRLAEPVAGRGGPHVVDKLTAVLSEVRERAPDALVVCVDYLTVLPPAHADDLPMTRDAWRRCHDLAADLVAATEAATTATGARLVKASAASADHHAWSAHPWTTRFVLPRPRRPRMPFHPNAAGMAAVTELLAAFLGAAPWSNERAGPSAR